MYTVRSIIYPRLSRELLQNEIDNARIKSLRTKIVNPGFPKVWLVKLTVIEISRRQGFFD